MSINFPPGFKTALCSVHSPESMLSIKAKHRQIVRDALKAHGPKSAQDLALMCDFPGAKDDGAVSVCAKALAGLVDDGQVYQIGSRSKHTRFALAAQGMVFA